MPDACSMPIQMRSPAMHQPAKPTVHVEKCKPKLSSSQDGSVFQHGKCLSDTRLTKQLRMAMQDVLSSLFC